MFNMPLDHIITILVSNNIDRKSVDYDDDHNIIRNCIGMSFTISLTYYGDVNVVRHSNLHFLFSGNTNVFVSTSDASNVFRVNLDEWENTSNHDSCWRTDGVARPINNLFSSMSSDIMAELERKGVRNIAPKDIHQHVYFIGSDSVHYGSLVHAAKYEDDGGYRRKIIKLTKSQLL